MLVTEEQAKELWCPAARVSDTGLGNRHPMVDDLSVGMAFARCIASDCMWWRWGSIKQRAADIVAWEEANDETCPRPNWRGYCGAASKP